MEPCAGEILGVLRACLVEKDPKRRLRDIGDVWRLLQEDAPATATASAKARARLSWAVAAAFAFVTVAALVTAGIVLSRLHELTSSSVAPQLVRFEVPFPENVIPGPRSIPALSPDGRRLAFVANDASGQGRIFVHTLDELNPRPLPGTEGAFGTPFWSADSRSVVFATALQFLLPGTLKKIDAGGGPALTLAEIPSTLRGGFWTTDGTIVFALVQRGLFSVSSAGGVPQPLTTIREPTAAHSYPSPLPDGRHFVYSRGVPGEVRVYIRSLDDAPESDDRAIVDNASNPIYGVSSRTPGSGDVLFVRDGTLMALPFDEAGASSIRRAAPYRAGRRPGTKRSTTCDDYWLVERHPGLPAGRFWSRSPSYWVQPPRCGARDHRGSSRVHCRRAGDRARWLSSSRGAPRGEQGRLVDIRHPTRRQNQGYRECGNQLGAFLVAGWVPNCLQFFADIAREPLSEVARR